MIRPRRPQAKPLLKTRGTPDWPSWSDLPDFAAILLVAGGLWVIVAGLIEAVSK